MLILCDSNLEDRWHVTPEIRDCVGWWPDGAPAWVDDPEYADGHRIVLDVIRKRRSDGEWYEDHPRVSALIDMAMTLNDVFRPWPGTPLADVYTTGDMQMQSRAMLARIQQCFDPAEAQQVLGIARHLAERRMHSEV